MISLIGHLVLSIIWLSDISGSHCENVHGVCYVIDYVIAIPNTLTGFVNVFTIAKDRPENILRVGGAGRGIGVNWGW